MALFLAMVLLQTASACTADAAAMIERARQRALELDLAAAIEEYAQAGRRGCEEARAAALYLEGLEAARDAYKAGGSEASLAPVRIVIAAFEAQAANGDTLADVARALLLAASAGAQSERDDMATLLEHATRLEARLVMANVRTLPVTAHEVAGDLWLQVHRFDTAQEAYLAARALLGPTPRIAIGLARVAVRLPDVKVACASYRELLAIWGARTATPPEIHEARTYVKEHECGR